MCMCTERPDQPIARSAAQRVRTRQETRVMVRDGPAPASPACFRLLSPLPRLTASPPTPAAVPVPAFTANVSRKGGNTHGY